MTRSAVSRTLRPGDQAHNNPNNDPYSGSDGSGLHHIDFASRISQRHRRDHAISPVGPEARDEGHRNHDNGQSHHDTISVRQKKKTDQTRHTANDRRQKPLPTG